MLNEKCSYTSEESANVKVSISKKATLIGTVQRNHL